MLSVKKSKSIAVKKMLLFTVCVQQNLFVEIVCVSFRVEMVLGVKVCSVRR